MAEKSEIGQIGEEIACRYLTERGFRVKERNYRKKWGELDIIAEKDDELHFVEVKTLAREADRDVSHETLVPEDNMHPQKIERLHRAILTYLLDRRIPEETEWQLDLLAVELAENAKQARCRFYESIS